MLDADMRGVCWTTLGAGGKITDPSAFLASPHLKYRCNLKRILQPIALFLFKDEHLNTLVNI